MINAFLQKEIKRFKFYPLNHLHADAWPNGRKDIIKRYLQRFGDQVEIVVMDRNQRFKTAVRKASIDLSLLLLCLVDLE
ncbi:hypothetical protein DEX24_12955 [Kurthia sibirica]|uniref:Uncharacterized protein n=1 Tax=Kurthia sibirica TaxID=202750 RepID=A0A2U3AIX9_9BACL|nr:hypothetical protein DEX24_12955 [Kurthia sibirica]